MEVLLWRSGVCQMQFRTEHVAFLVWSLGRSLDTFICVVLCVLLLILTLSHRSSIPRRRSICCIVSKLMFLSGVLGFTTGLTRWVDGSWFSVISVVCVFGVSIIGILFVGVRVCLTTVIVYVFTITICVVFSLVLLSFELTELIWLVTWFFAVVTCRLGFLRV